ncbi:hypothetical protein ABEB36_003302 [Hypothenemus hampei]|uniref:UDP-glucuronosyltransferase n=1 Tax=Hypothenemus hampei TaxID=57062 RepID=A0ABD1F8Q3_HYPHA
MLQVLKLLLIFVSTVHGANILITYETARRSHQIWIGELAQALTKRGHNITVGGVFARALPESDKYHPLVYEGIFITHYKFNKSEHLTSSPLRRMYLNHEYNWAICNRTYHSKGFNELWNYPDNFTFDLILMDITFGPCLYPLIERFGRPYTIGFTPSALTPYLSEKFGNPSYSISPLLDPEDPNASFLYRVYNYLFTKLEILFKSHVDTLSLQYLANRMLNRTFNFYDLERSISLLFVNEYPFLNEPKSLTPNIIPIGGLHIKKEEELPGILNSIIANANQGIVIFSTGTDIQQHIFGEETKMNFARAFDKLVQKTVVWKDNIDDDEHPFRDKPSNILIHKWIPQNDVLGHVHTKLLITTGSTLSIQEAIYHGVAVIGLPIYDEHHKNIQFILDRNLGLKLDFNNLTEENIYETVNRILKNPIYLENMEKYAWKFRDQPQSALVKAVYWVEYVLRHNATQGADFLTPKARFLGSFKASYFDVELFLIIAVIISLIVVVKVLELVLNQVKKPIEKKNEKKKQ